MEAKAAHSRSNDTKLATTNTSRAAVNQQARQLDHIAQCVREGRESDVPGEMGRRDMIIVEAIYTSAAQGGKRIEIKV